MLNQLHRFHNPMACNHKNYWKTVLKKRMRVNIHTVLDNQNNNKKIAVEEDHHNFLSMTSMEMKKIIFRISLINYQIYKNYQNN